MPEAPPVTTAVFPAKAPGPPHASTTSRALLFLPNRMGVLHRTAMGVCRARMLHGAATDVTKHVTQGVVGVARNVLLRGSLLRKSREIRYNYRGTRIGAGHASAEGTATSAPAHPGALSRGGQGRLCLAAPNRPTGHRATQAHTHVARRYTYTGEATNG
ncbi:hypothetical protein T492DRAFT_832574 [Pavlovales sp. CCMP2436]|nr:hypothetical protein T492DRAFT_832574 [Pavlovales sp. CCMP2436]